MTISPARLFLTRELHRIFMLQVLTWWTSLQTPSQPAGVTLQRLQLPQWLRGQAEKWSRLLSHWTATHWDRWSLLTNRGCVSWTTQEPCLSSACQFHAHSSLQHLRWSQLCRSLAKSRELLLPVSVIQQSIAFLQEAGYDDCEHRAMTIWILACCFYYTLWSNPLLAILFNSACHLPHFLLHLKAPEASLTSWPFKNAIVFLLEKDGASVPFPAPIHTFHMLLSPKSLCGQIPYSISGVSSNFWTFLGFFLLKSPQIFTISPVYRTKIIVSFCCTEPDCSKHCWH